MASSRDRELTRTARAYLANGLGCRMKQGHFLWLLAVIVAAGHGAGWAPRLAVPVGAAAGYVVGSTLARISAERRWLGVCGPALFGVVAALLVGDYLILALDAGPVFAGHLTAWFAASVGAFSGYAVWSSWGFADAYPEPGAGERRALLVAVVTATLVAFGIHHALAGPVVCLAYLTSVRRSDPVRGTLVRLAAAVVLGVSVERWIAVSGARVQPEILIPAWLVTAYAGGRLVRLTVHAGPGRVDEDSGIAALVAGAQGHPWRVSFRLVVCAAGLSLLWLAVGVTVLPDRALWGLAVPPALAVLSLGGLVATHFTRGDTSVVARAAPLSTVALTVASLLWCLDGWSQFSGAARWAGPWLIVTVAVSCGWAVGVAVFSRAPRGRGPPSRWVQAAVGVLVLGPLLFVSVLRPDSGPVAAGAVLAWVLLVPVVFDRYVRSDVSVQDLGRGALALGVLSGTAATFAVFRSGAALLGGVAFGTLWSLMAVAVISSRRARSLTTIPVDHPVRTDFAPGEEA